MLWFSTQSPAVTVDHQTDDIHQTFIIVRPPPSKTNHPLNLQVQLVPYVNRNERATRRSVDANASRETLADTGETGVPIQRTISAGSNRSDTGSTYSANGSISSASSGSTISGRRIVPLYNLHAHNVMTNTITDAGTDAKVAKFFKRGLEVMGLAILEPIEVWGHYSWEDMDEEVADFRRPSISASAIPDLPTVVEVPSNATSPGSVSTKSSEPSSSKKLFGRLFKKKETLNTPPGPSASLPQPPPTILEPPSSSASSSLHVEPYLQPPVLGLQARLKSPTMPPHGRPSTYVWVIRKWVKGSDESWIGGMADSVGGVLGMRDGSERNATEVTDVEVRFEWKKMKARGEESRRRRTGTGASGLEAQDGKARRHSSVLERRDTASTLGSSVHEIPSDAALSKGGLLSNPAQKAQNRLSLQGLIPRNKNTSSAPGPMSSLAPNAEPARAPSPNPPASIATTNTTGEDDGEESDPEDSETPWICSLHLRSRTYTHRRPSTVSHSDHPPLEPSLGEPRVDVKLKVATLAPAPHHPKVVAQIKTPYPLQDVLIDEGVVRPRTTAGLPPSEGNDEGALVLTAEEIKDVVSCTGLWVIVREGYGGLAKRRKGDGWLIRG